MRGYLGLKITVLVLLFIFSVILGIILGPVNISFRELFLTENQQIVFLRILRVLTAFLAGGGLAVCGVALQAVLRNPLAEPYLLGTSSGAGLGAVLAIVLGLSRIYLPFMAFLCAVITVLLVYNLARLNGKIHTQSLILSGVIVSIALSAITVLLVTQSNNEALYGIMWWLWGSMQVYDAKLLFLVGLMVAAGVAVIFWLSQDLNAISTGEEEATHLGIDTERVKNILFFVTSLITASLVCLCGIIGFVGLIVPHAMRMVFGPNHRVLIPVSFFASAVFMIFCDLFSRTVFAPSEIPIGVVTAVIGAPVFIFLLKARKR